MAFTTEYELQHILHRACESTCQSSERASRIELGKYNHYGEISVLDIDESDAIDVND